MFGISASALHPASAAATYDHVASGAGTAGSGFAGFLTHAIGTAVDQSASAEIAARNGLQGQGDLTGIVTSVAQAQLALQTTVAIRDRLIQAYQSIMNMPI
ncbi:flagellar hook-basal body complex protein FliE [Acidiphilium sp. AL]|uniref:Flagellar hook-basal body complex protein FliE n=1 Tax=Acidiphilium iwatense TaxID=768198 RepID=A0ABS9E046_9PROT|nr:MULTISPECIES: flagellar hook-basal body complex protein FliE [Acidiphilium]MCF3947395.1 flagellar hook-basal body complex protein FliE [Acidiphilium iwatense]MCU4161718.1 flagellar hook-basal body complex protein FliE [Acidiphilium sp. AL]